MKIINKKIVIICAILIFIPLTYMKFTTVRIRYPQDETNWLVKPNKLVILNQKIMKGSNDENKTSEMYKGKWYWEKDYAVITTFKSSLNIYLYDTLIILWWIILIYLIKWLLKAEVILLKNKLV